MNFSHFLKQSLENKNQAGAFEYKSNTNKNIDYLINLNFIFQCYLSQFFFNNLQYAEGQWKWQNDELSNFEKTSIIISCEDEFRKMLSFYNLITDDKENNIDVLKNTLDLDILGKCNIALMKFELDVIEGKLDELWLGDLAHLAANLQI